jgi:hypothetical protein
MNYDGFLSRLRSIMLPAHYQNDLSEKVSNGCLLLSRSLDYVFLAMPYSTIPKNDYKSAYAKKVVRSAMLRPPLILDLILEKRGLFLVYYGPSDLWKNEVPKFKVDKTGLHLIILQSIHFVDPETGDNINKRTSWGPIKFGFCGDVIKEIESLCKIT